MQLRLSRSSRHGTPGQIAGGVEGGPRAVELLERIADTSARKLSIRAVSPSRLSRVSIVAASLGDLAGRQGSIGQEASMWPESSCASAHSGDWRSSPLAAHWADRAARYGSVAGKPARLTTASRPRLGHSTRADGGSCARTRPLVAGRFVEVFVVGGHVFQGVGRRQLGFVEGQNSKPRVTTVGPPPVGQGFASVNDLSNDRLAWV